MRVHRWMGVAFCVLFLAWFLSGMVLMYCRFPQVGAADRLAHKVPLVAGQIQIRPAQALAALAESATPMRIQLSILDGRPVYRFEFGSRFRLVFADDGRLLDSVSRETALRVAADWTGFPPGAAWIQGLVTDDDQWTFDSAVHRYAPFWKYSWPNGEEIYVSRTTGEVAQDTTRNSRIGAYCGAIPHWLYFAPLRRHAGLWSQ